VWHKQQNKEKEAEGGMLVGFKKLPHTFPHWCLLPQASRKAPGLASEGVAPNKNWERGQGKKNISYQKNPITRLHSIPCQCLLSY